MKIMICINSAWNVVNFRAALVRRLVAEGHEIVAVVPDDGSIPDVERLGARVIAMPMDNSGVSPVRDAGLFRRLLAVMRAERPGVYLGWTIKPNTYGSLAARLLGIPAINNISGLGEAFIRKNWLTTVAETLYRVSLAKADTVFFQNPTDRDLFVSRGLVRQDATVLLPGSGIDASAFDPALHPVESDGAFRFLMVARVRRDKGVMEYVEAARIVKARYPEVRIQLLGALNTQSSAGIDRATVDRWVSEGLIEYLGVASDVRSHIAKADCIVLPSYREGTSRVLLEAAAMATPAIATDVPGCRDVIRHGYTGRLCAVRDAADLASAMEHMLSLSDGQRREMGAAAREMAITDYAESIVIDRYLAAIEAAAGR